MSLNLSEIQQAVDRLIANVAGSDRMYYDLHYNPEPLDVTLTRLDDTGQEVEVTVPNRAKLMQWYGRSLTPPVRQAILSCKVSGTDPDFLEITGAGTDTVEVEASQAPLVMAFAAGFSTDPAGPVDYLVALDSDQSVSGFTASAVNHIYVERAENGDLSLGHSDLAPAWGGEAPTGPTAGQHWYSSVLQRMYVWDGAAWQPVQRLFIGQATVDASGQVTAVECAPVNRGMATEVKAGVLNVAEDGVWRQGAVCIRDGTNDYTLDVELFSRWNSDVIPRTDNIGKGETVGAFSLSADGSTLTIDGSFLTGTVLAANLSNWDSSTGIVGTPLNVRTEVSGGNIKFVLFGLDGAQVDLSTEIGGGMFYFFFSYVTTE